MCIKTCEISADGVSVVLVEEERLEFNLEELVVDSGQETGARAMQLGICKTSAKNRPNHIRFNSRAFITSVIWVHFIITGYRNWTDLNRQCGRLKRAQRK